MIEDLVHLRCAGIYFAQYTDTRTCHLHKGPRLTTHADITPHLQPLSKPPTHSTPAPPTHRNPNTDTRPTLLLLPQDW